MTQQKANIPQDIPSHVIDPTLLLETMSELVEHLMEAHQAEIDNNHYGDDAADCSYCEVLERARAILRSHGIE